MKKWMFAIFLALLMTNNSWAFLYEIPILTKEEIKALSDSALTERYIDAKVELDASRTFHGKSGFTPKEYSQYKDLVNFIIRIRQEMQTRELEAPPVDEWIR